MNRWPTITDLSKASLSDVLIEWQGLGYNRRAKHLLETAKIIAITQKGKFPQEKKELSALPGFGPYMVSALRVFAFDMQEPVVDVNVRRIHERTGLEAFDIPKNDSDQWHQLLMDFGSIVCTAKTPKCESCPVSRLCQANKTAKVAGFLTYASWLAVQPRVKKQSQKDKGKKFEETDRYFRGRIIDFLRAGEQPMQEVWIFLHDTHNLTDRARFGSLIEGLVVDGLIQVRGNTVSFA